MGLRPQAGPNFARRVRIARLPKDGAVEHELDPRSAGRGDRGGGAHEKKALEEDGVARQVRGKEGAGGERRGRAALSALLAAMAAATAGGGRSEQGESTTGEAVNSSMAERRPKERGKKRAMVETASREGGERAEQEGRGNVTCHPSSGHPNSRRHLVLKGDALSQNDYG